MRAASFPEVSKASVGDLGAVLALVQRSELLETGIAAAIAGFFITRAAGRVTGCAGLEAHGAFGLLRSLAVEPSARRAGLGTALVGAVVAAARAQGLRQLFLLTTTAPEFFRRRGFEIVARSSVPPEIAEAWEFRVGCPLSASVMRLSLNEA